jgi:ATP-dependent DNA ligase
MDEIVVLVEQHGCHQSQFQTIQSTLRQRYVIEIERKKERKKDYPTATLRED